MTKFNDVNELPFTSEQLTYFESEMRKYKVPWLYKIVFGSLYKGAAIFMPILIIIVAVLGIIGTKHPEYNLWVLTKGIALGLIFGIGGLTFVSWVWHRLKVLNECKRLGITLNEWNTMAIAFQITFI